jgi:hypothetical protein
MDWRPGTSNWWPIVESMPGHENRLSGCENASEVRLLTTPLASETPELTEGWSSKVEVLVRSAAESLPELAKKKSESPSNV